MRPVIKINTRNKYHNELWIGDSLVANGNNGLENVEIKTQGKRSTVVLTLTGVNVIITDAECPEVHRYDKILDAFGDSPKLAKLSLVCDMLKISPTACDGCKWKPQGARFESSKMAVNSRSPVG